MITLRELYAKEIPYLTKEETMYLIKLWGYRGIAKSSTVAALVQHLIKLERGNNGI